MNKGALRLALAGGVVGVCGIIANVTGLSEPGGLALKNQPAPAPVAEVAPAPAPVETIGARQQLEREAEEALERYNDPAHHCSAVLNRCW